MTEPPGPLLPRHPPSVDPETPSIRGGQVAIGIVAAIVGHVLTIVLTYPKLSAVNVAAQGVLFLVCSVGGIVLLSRRGRYRGLGLGLLIGWAFGVITLPVIGFGLCMQALSNGS